MELRKRQAKILQDLFEKKKISVDAILNEYGISKRTLYYDLNKINDWLSEDNFGMVSIEDKEIVIEITNLAGIEKQMHKGKEYYFSSEERRAIEFLFITLNCEKIVIDDLKNAFDVSRNTILSDLKCVKKEVEESGELKFCNSIRQGYYVTGDESVLRKIIQEKINELRTPEGKAVLKIYMQNSLFSLTKNEIDFYKLCICIIKQYELDIKNEYILSDMQTEGFMIQVSWIRSLKGYTVKLSDDEKNALTGTLSYRSVENSVEKMAKCGIEMVQEEVYYLASMLLGIETTGFKTHREEERFIEKIADQFISSFERITCLVFYNRSKLRHELFHHLRALFYRMKYGTPSDNPLTRDIKQMYSFVFEATRRAIAEVGNDFMRDIPDTEIAYLCIYMVSNLDEKKVHQSAKYDGSILIVGPKNMAIATLIKEQIQNLLGDSFEYDVISLSRLKTRMLSEYVMVVLVDVPRGKVTGENVVETSIVLNKEDQQKIVDILQNEKLLSKYNNKIEDILSIVEENVTQPIERKELYFSLFRYFNSRKGYNPSEQPGMECILGEKTRTEVLPDHMEWEDTLHYGSELLDSSEGRLWERIQNLVSRDKLQTYRFEKDAILIHYPMQGEQQREIKLLKMISEEGVVCPDGKKAYLILCLTTIDKYSHFSLLDEVYRFYGKKTKITELVESYKQ